MSSHEYTPASGDRYEEIVQVTTAIEVIRPILQQLSAETTFVRPFDIDLTDVPELSWLNRSAEDSPTCIECTYRTMQGYEATRLFENPNVLRTFNHEPIDDVLVAVYGNTELGKRAAQLYRLRFTKEGKFLEDISFVERSSIDNLEYVRKLRNDATTDEGEILNQKFSDIVSASLSDIRDLRFDSSRQPVALSDVRTLYDLINRLDDTPNAPDESEDSEDEVAAQILSMEVLETYFQRISDIARTKQNVFYLGAENEISFSVQDDNVYNEYTVSMTSVKGITLFEYAVYHELPSVDPTLEQYILAWDGRGRFLPHESAYRLRPVLDSLPHFQDNLESPEAKSLDERRWKSSTGAYSAMTSDRMIDLEKHLEQCLVRIRGLQ